MPLAEIVIIEVGSAIAKSLLQLWMKDIPIASDASSSILEILKSYTTDKISQWKGQHQFEAIGVKIGESLLPLFEIEGARLDESSRIAVWWTLLSRQKKCLCENTKCSLCDPVIAQQGLSQLLIPTYLDEEDCLPVFKIVFHNHSKKTITQP